MKAALAVKELSNYESWSWSCLEQIDLLLSRAADCGIKIPRRA